MAAVDYPDNPNAGLMDTIASKQSQIIRNVQYDNNFEFKDDHYWKSYLGISGQSGTMMPGVLWRYNCNALRSTDSDPVAYTIAFYTPSGGIGSGPGPSLDPRGADLPRVFSNWQGRVWDANLPPRCAGIIENAVFRSKANGISDRPSRQGTVISGGISTMYAPTKLPAQMYPRIGDIVLWQPPEQKDTLTGESFGIGTQKNLKIAGVDTSNRNYAIIVPLVYSTFGSASMFRNILHFLDPKVGHRADTFDGPHVVSPAVRTVAKLCNILRIPEGQDDGLGNIKTAAEAREFAKVLKQVTDRSEKMTGFGLGVLERRLIGRGQAPTWETLVRNDLTIARLLALGMTIGAMLSDDHHATLLYHQFGKIARDGRISVKKESCYDVLIGLV